MQASTQDRTVCCIPFHNRSRIVSAMTEKVAVQSSLCPACLGSRPLFAVWWKSGGRSTCSRMLWHRHCNPPPPPVHYPRPQGEGGRHLAHEQCSKEKTLNYVVMTMRL